MDAALIENAVVESGASPDAQAEALELLGTWLRQCPERELGETTLATELKFSVQIGVIGVLPVYVIGVLDRLSKDAGNTYIASEWKTSRVKREGSRWGARQWLQSILRSDQIAVYGLAAANIPQIKDSNLRIRVRAAAKTPAGIEIWPVNAKDECYDLGPERYQDAANAYMNTARSILAMDPSDKPWQSTGPHCTQFFKDCVYLNECEARLFAAVQPGKLRFDPKPYESFHVPQDRPAIVLSHTSYSEFNQCREKYRHDYECGLPREAEESYELQVGRAFHAALAVYYTHEH